MSGLLHDIMEMLLPSILKLKDDDAAYDKLRRQREPNYSQPILYGADGNALIREKLEEDGPLMVSRLGSSELTVIAHYLEHRKGEQVSYPEVVREEIANASGVFSTDDGSLDSFSQLFLEGVAKTDIMGVWFRDYEDVVCNTFAADARLVELGCLEPFHFEDPSSAALANKEVLVVHPFAETIQKQYTEKRELLFPNPEVLPEFELKTLQAVQSSVGTETEFPTWFDALDHMCEEIDKIDFDAAIIGAGAYGLPLAAYVKDLGKKVIHMGGATQLLFGIRGKRWEQGYAGTTAKLFNEHWVRPSETETPANHQRLEDGCYW